jgi:BT4734-like, N-terminal domain
MNETPLLDRIVPIFNGVGNTQIYDRKTIQEIFSEIQSDHQEISNDLKQLRLVDKNKYDKRKTSLMGATFSVDFNSRRLNSDLKRYNELIVIDIDKLSSEDLLKQKEYLNNDPYVLANWISPSGFGIKGILPLEFELDYSNENIDDYHKRAYSIVSQYFMDEYTILLDEQCNHFGQLCFISHDSEIVVKDTYKKFVISEENLKEIDITRTENKRIRKSAVYTVNKKNEPMQESDMESGKRELYKKNRKKMQQIKKYLKKRELSITEGYRDWIYVAFALSNTFPYKTAQRYFMALSSFDVDKFDKDESLFKLDECYKKNKGDISFGSILFYAKEKGYHKELGEGAGT